MSQVLRLGFAGLGVASTQILPALSGLPTIKLTAAADTRKDALKKFHEEFGVAVFDSVEKMCESPDVDAVYVATPSHLHAEHAIAAVRKKKHVVVEKPMALTLAECKAINAAVEEHGVKLLCGHTHSFDAPIRKIREIVSSRQLGRLRMIHSWNYNEFMHRPRMKHELATTRGVVLNQGPHQVDIVRLIGGGKLRSVRATTGTMSPSRPHEGNYVCYLEFEDGVPATLVYSGYGFFDTAELFGWIGEGGQRRDPETNLKVRRKLHSIANPEEEASHKEAMRYGGQKQGELSHWWQGERKQPFFGFTLFSCSSNFEGSPPASFIIRYSQSPYRPMSSFAHLTGSSGALSFACSYSRLTSFKARSAWEGLPGSRSQAHTTRDVRQTIIRPLNLLFMGLCLIFN